MGLIMTEDGHVRPLRVSDLKEVAERDERIHQLEELNRALAAEVDAQRPVVEAAIDMKEHGCGQCETALEQAVVTYQASKPK